MDDSRWCPLAPYVAMDQYIYSIVRWYSALRTYCVCSTVVDGGADGVAGAVGPRAAAVSSPARGSLEIVSSTLMSATGIGSPMCCSMQFRFVMMSAVVGTECPVATLDAVWTSSFITSIVSKPSKVFDVTIIRPNVSVTTSSESTSESTLISYCACRVLNPILKVVSHRCCSVHVSPDTLRAPVCEGSLSAKIQPGPCAVMARYINLGQTSSIPYHSGLLA